MEKQVTKTAMSSLIEWIEVYKQENFAYPFASDIESKAIELRDTVEKEQRKKYFSDGHKKGYHRGVQDAHSMLDYFTDYDQIEKDHNETYGNHETKNTDSSEH